jgi:hypothetical protein
MRPWGPWLTTAICLVGQAIEVFGALIIVTGIAWLILLRVRRLIAEIIVNASRQHSDAHIVGHASRRIDTCSPSR